MRMRLGQLEPYCSDLLRLATASRAGATLAVLLGFDDLRDAPFVGIKSGGGDGGELTLMIGDLAWLVSADGDALLESHVQAFAAAELERASAGTRVGAGVYVPETVGDLAAAFGFGPGATEALSASSSSFSSSSSSSCVSAGERAQRLRLVFALFAAAGSGGE